MSRISFNRKRAKLKQLLGIRARLALLAVILGAPLMLDRARSLEDTRSRQIALASQEFADLAQHSADTQREVISSVETMLKSAAYIRASGGVGRSCEILRASLPLNLPWIRSIMIVSKDGLVQCSTLNNLVGLDLSDREYIKQARETGGFVFSDFLFAKSNHRPIMMAAYPVSAINREEDAIVVAGINLDWMSKIMSNLGRRPGVSAVLVDSAGVVLAAPPAQAPPTGLPLAPLPLLYPVRAALKRLPAEFVPLARAFNAMAAQLIERERELVATNERLTVIASIDMLSGLANRRGFQSRLDFEWMKAQQHGGALSLLMIDVDHFKLFNDSYGHPEGDVCLARLGETLAGIAAETMGFAGRYGGGEFCLLVPNIDSRRALEIGETVRAAVQELAMPHCTSHHQTVTVSVGVACARPNEKQQPGDLIEAADAALYAAKHRGRNAVVEHGIVRMTDGGRALAS